jgi:hypothetical protein
MKLTHFLAATALALATAVSSYAQTDVWIAGAPAIRQPLTTAIEALVDAGGGSPIRAFNGSNIITANVVSWRNATVGGNSVNIYLTYNGSAGGYQATAGNKPVRFLNNNLTGGSQVDVLTDTGASAQTHVPDFHIANEFQVSTPWVGTNNVAYGPGNSTYETLSDRISGILPLRIAASPAAPNNLNLTPQLAKTLYLTGEIRLSQLTGNPADYNKRAYALSRGIDSGVRTLWATNNGVGTAPEIISYLASVTVSSPITGAVITSGGSGYTSAPAVTISGSGGTGATASATISGGKVTAVNILTPGSGFTASPSVSFNNTGTGGKLAAATAVIAGGTVTDQVPYPAGNVIGVDYNEGNGGYVTFGPLLTALTSTLTFSDPGDIYITILSDADAQVAFAAGAKEVAWNGNKLGALGTYGNAGTPTANSAPNPSTGSASPALAYGQYELWGYVRLAHRTSLTGVPLAVLNTINTRLRTVDSPVLLKDVNVRRTQPDGGRLLPGRNLGN